MAVEIAASKVLVQRLNNVLNNLASRKDVHSAIMAVARCDESFHWIGTAGVAKPDSTKMADETPYFIASVDKLCTATVIFKLYECGQINLDEPISTYLNNRLIDGIHRIGTVDYTTKITVRHLLNHTSGLADWLEDIPKAGQSLFERITRDGDMSMSVEDIMNIVRCYLSPHFPPQSIDAKRQKVRYSDTNYILLIATIEAVTGKPLHEVYDEFLFHPLDMSHTWLAGYSQPIAPTPEPSMVWFKTKPLVIPMLMRSTWAIYSTARDTLRFIRAFISGSVFDSPGTFTLMQQRWNRFGFPLDKAAIRLPSWPIEYGLGIMRFHDPILKIIGNLPRILRPIYPAPAVIGHTGSTGSWLFYCPQLDLLLSGTVNQVTAGAIPYRLVSKILRIFDNY